MQVVDTAGVVKTNCLLQERPNVNVAKHTQEASQEANNERPVPAHAHIDTHGHKHAHIEAESNGTQL